MSKYKYYRILRFFRLLSKEDYKAKVAPYLADMDMNCRIIEKSRLFDKKWYLEHNPDVKEDPIKHYLYKGWKEHRECTPYFNGEDYLKMYPDVAEANMNPLLHWELHGKFEGRYAEFSIPYKLQIIANRFLHGINNISIMLQHFQCTITHQYDNKTSDYKLIAKSKYFNKKWYIKQYPEVLNNNLDPIEHYLKYGWKEGKNPNINFDGNDYLTRYTGVKKAKYCPLLHYEKHGKKEGRIIRSIPQNKYVFNTFRKIKFIFFNISGKLIYHNKIQKNKHAKILVCLHLYYMESWPIIKKYLQNLNHYKYDLIVTYINNHYTQDTLNKIKEFRSDVQLYEYPNQGFDIGPFIDVLSKVNIKKYDIIYKLHSKGTHRESIFIYHQIFKLTDWFFNLFDGILGGWSVHQTIDHLLNNSKVGLVAAKNLIIQDPKHKQFFTNQIAKRNKIKIKPDYHYVAGTCFACKAKSLKHILKKNYTINDFEEAKRGEFSFAHAMERIVCAEIEYQGYTFRGIPVYHNLYKKELCNKEKNSSLRLLDDNRFQLDYDFFYKTLETRNIYNYEIINLKIKDIYRRWEGKNYPLKETSAYAYLNGDIERYKKYCDINSQCSKFQMSPKRFDNLSKSISKSFNKKMMPVVAGQNNIIQDGQHRLVILLNKYGEEHKVTCLKLYYQKTA